MSSVLHVAQAIIDELGPIEALKLQKLVYYCQAWALAWDEEPLFPEEIQAWGLGPVVPRLYREHRQQSEVKSIAGGDPSRLGARQREIIARVLRAYGGDASSKLIDRTHQEHPWRAVREAAGCEEGDSCSEVISPSMLRDYYRARIDTEDGLISAAAREQAAKGGFVTHAEFWA